MTNPSFLHADSEDSDHPGHPPSLIRVFFMRTAKTQISLDIRPVWSESSLPAWRKLGPLATHWAHREDSNQTGQMTLIRLGGCPGWSESLLDAQSFCWFCHEAAQLSFHQEVINYESPLLLRRYLNNYLWQRAHNYLASDCIIALKQTYCWALWHRALSTIMNPSDSGNSQFRTGANPPTEKLVSTSALTISNQQINSSRDKHFKYYKGSLVQILSWKNKLLKKAITKREDKQVSPDHKRSKRTFACSCFSLTKPIFFFPFHHDSLR